MEDLLIKSPLFIAYAKCVVILALKMSFTAWTTVYIMVTTGYGMRNEEDKLQGWANSNPKPNQLQTYEPAEKQRRIMGHDLENNVPFFAVGLLYCLFEAGDENLLYLYTSFKVAHHFVYWSGQRHEVRATFWTVTNSAFLYMCWLVWGKI